MQVVQQSINEQISLRSPAAEATHFPVHGAPRGHPLGHPRPPRPGQDPECLHRAVAGPAGQDIRCHHQGRLFPVGFLFLSQCEEPSHVSASRKVWVLSRPRFAAVVSFPSPCVSALATSEAGSLKEWGTKTEAPMLPICQAGGVFIIDGGGVRAAHICSPAWVNETFFSKLLRFLIADCTRVTKLTQGSSMHAQ